MTIKQLEELEGKRTLIQRRVAKAFEEASVTPEGQDGKAVYDFTKVKTYGEGKSTREIADAVKADNDAMNDLGAEIDALKAADDAFKSLKEPTKSVIHPQEDLPANIHDRRGQALKSVGQLIVEHAGYRAMLAAKSGGQKQMAIDLPDVGLKTLFETGAGWSPESVRSGRVVDAVTRPIQLLDLIPGGNIDQAAAVYMLETTRTHSAAETAEGGTYAESTFALTQQTQAVQKITDSVPVTDEQLEDVSFAQSYLDQRIRFGVRQRLDNQVLNGDGISPNLLGILNVGSIQTHAKGADPVPDAYFKSMTLVSVTGRATPSGIVMHPNDWQSVRLLRTTDGIYIWGNPAEAGPQRMWGLPVAVADAIAENTGLVGDFANFCQLLERRGLTVEVGYTGSQFVQGKQTIRASLRAVMVVYRAAAFCTVTGV